MQRALGSRVFAPLAFDRPSLLDRVRRDLGTVFCIAGSKSVAADQNRAITFRPVRPRCKLWLDRVRRGNTVSSGFEREYLLRILPSILGKGWSQRQIRLRISLSVLRFHPSHGTLIRKRIISRVYLVRYSPRLAGQWFFSRWNKKKGKNSDRGGSSLGGEKEG